MKYSLRTAVSVLFVIVSLVSLAQSAGLESSNIGTAAQNTAVSIFVRRCASCHGRDGRANTAKGRLRDARDLTDARWQADVSDERIFNSINNGRGKMPAYGKKIPEAAIDSLVSYVRSLKR
ncbi:MAG: c-type cytochrome [Pyrinomonadaceae bacterium]